MNNEKLNNMLQQVPGTVWMMACACLYCGMGMFVRQLVCVYRADIYWVGWLRFAFGLVVMVLPAALGVWRLKVNNRQAFCYRGLIGATGQFLLFAVIAKVGLGRGTVLVYLLGVVGSIAAIPILKEKPRPIVAFAVLLACAGVLFSCHAGIPVGWEWLAIAGALCSGVTLPIVRLLRRTDSNVVTFYSQSLFGVFMLLPMLFFASMPGSWIVVVMILAMSCLDIGGQLCMSQGFSRLPVAKGAALMMLIPVISLLAGVLFFSEPLTSRQWFGCGLVLSASFMAIAVRGISLKPMPG